MFNILERISHSTRVYSNICLISQYVSTTSTCIKLSMYDYMFNTSDLIIRRKLIARILVEKLVEKDLIYCM